MGKNTNTRRQSNIRALDGMVKNEEKKDYRKRKIMEIQEI
jgi:hypothetical protein